MTCDKICCKVVVDMPHYDHEICFGSLSEALSAAEDIYHRWIDDALRDMPLDAEGYPAPTDKQIDDWDWMIENCYCYVIEYSEEAGCYDDEMHHPDPDVLFDIGWEYWENRI